MARLTKDEWAELRAEWEASPRQGLTWLLKSAGGRWDITEEPLRKRRMAEGWTKVTDSAEVARRARAGADRLSVARAATEPPQEPPPTSDAGPEVGVVSAKTAAADVADAATDLRTKLIDLHRNEWKAARRLVYEAMKEGEKATGFEKAKFAKITTESLKNIQEGERRAWGLDADLIDYDALTDAQLEALSKGKLLR